MDDLRSSSSRRQHCSFLQGAVTVYREPLFYPGPTFRDRVSFEEVERLRPRDTEVVHEDDLSDHKRTRRGVRGKGTG